MHFNNVTDLPSLQKAISLFSTFRKENTAAPGGFSSCHIWILSNYSTQFVAGALPAALADKAIWGEVQETPFNQWEGVLYDKKHPAFQAGTDMVLLLLSSVELAFRGETDPKQVADRIVSAIRFQSVSSTAKLVLTLPEPLPEETSSISWAYEWRQHVIGHLKSGLADTDVLLLDIEPLIRSVGTAKWYADRFYITSKIPCHPNCLPALVTYLANVVRSLLVSPCKLIITDLDDTLWGKAVGDEGYDQVDLDAAGDGLSYLRLQRLLKSLHDRGVLLAIASRNDRETALSVFKKRPEMILRESDFSAIEINWDRKSHGIQKILGDLNLSTAGVLFLDDNPKERLEVLNAFPNLIVPELPENPIQRVPFLIASGWLEVIPSTREDKNRAKYYQEEKQREAVRQEVSGDPDAYLKQLEMTLSPLPIKENMDRVVELINKTNQFNLTTRRHGRGEISQIMEKRGMGFCFRLKDRFGDYGIISVILICPTPLADTFQIESWVMSCRAMGRTVEQVVLRFVLQKCNEHGIKKLIGEYIPTEKNKPVAELLSNLGFINERKEGQSTLSEILIAEGLNSVDKSYVTLRTPEPLPDLNLFGST